MDNQHCVWEIFLPRHSDKTTVFHIKNHRDFQKKIENKATIIMSVSHANYWEADNGILYSKDFFPMRLVCSEKQLHEILDMAIDHYKINKVNACLVTNKIIERTNGK